VPRLVDRGGARGGAGQVYRAPRRFGIRNQSDKSPFQMLYHEDDHRPQPGRGHDRLCHEAIARYRKNGDEAKVAEVQRNLAALSVWESAGRGGHRRGAAGQ
jgi:hypothetical protein